MKQVGLRALGNRSIIADARNPNIKDIINSKIKRREFLTICTLNGKN